jgi:hypothetical protein
MPRYRIVGPRPVAKATHSYKTEGLQLRRSSAMLLKDKTARASGPFVVPQRSLDCDDDRYITASWPP